MVSRPLQVLLRLDPLQRVAGVGGEEPGEVLGLAQRHRLREGALQVLAEPAADALRRLARRGNELPERRCVLGQAEPLALARAPVRLLADDEEIAQVGDDHQPVGLEIPGDLVGLRRQPGVVGDGFHLDHAALWVLTLAWLALLELARSVQSEIRMPGAGVGNVGDAVHARPQIRADGIQQVVDGGVIGALARARAGAVRVAQLGEIILDNLDELVGQNRLSPPTRTLASRPSTAQSGRRGHPGSRHPSLEPRPRTP